MLPLRHRDWYHFLRLRVYLDLEPVLPWAFERDIECEDGSCLHFEYACWWLGEVHLSLAIDDLFVLLVQEPNLHVVLTHLCASSLQSNHEVQAWMHSWELLYPDVMEDADN